MRQKKQPAAATPRPRLGVVPQAEDLEQPDYVDLVDRPACEITTAKVVWLWPHRLQRGTVAIIQGDKRVGKSTWLRALAAHVSGGPAIPEVGKGRRVPAGVLYYVGEESLEKRVAPGLVAAGAKMERVFCADVYGDDQLALPSDCDRLQRRILYRQAALVIIDPIFSFSDGTCDLEGPTLPARRFMKELARVAAATQALIVFSRNLTKDRSRGALDSGRGSAELANAARSVLHLAKLPGSDLHALAVAACNDGKPVPAITYRIKGHDDQGVLDLVGKSDQTADELAAGDDGDLERSQLERAKELIKVLVPAGEIDSKVVKTKCEDAMIAIRTVQKAALQLGVVVRRKGSRDSTTTLWARPKGGWQA